MKTVINVTLGGIVFAIEQDAHNTLAKYLEDIKKNLSQTDDYEEIVGDIESAIAEKFTARKRSEKSAVTSDDVSDVIAEMGRPADFGEGDNSGTTNSQESSDTATKKRLYRDTDDAVIAGVASGLAKYFDVDPVIVRLIFVVSIFFNGLGILAYIILWLVVPKAETTAQKYAMRGERVTLKEITEQVKKNLKGFDEVDVSQAKNAWAPVRNFLNKLFTVLGILLVACIQIFRYVGGFLILLAGALTLAGLVSVYSVVLLSEHTFMPPEAQTAVDIMLNSSSGIIAIISSFIVSAIPLLFSILVGGSLLAKRSLFTASKTITLIVVWIVAVVLAITTSALQLEKVMHTFGAGSLENGVYQIHINVDEGDVDRGSIELQWEDEAMTTPSTEPKDLPDAVVIQGSSTELMVQ